MSNYKKERPTRSCPYNSMVACKYVPEHTPPRIASVSPLRLEA